MANYALKGNAKWQALNDEDRFQGEDHLLESYMRAKDKRRWRRGPSPHTIRATISINGKIFRFGTTNIRKLAKRLGISKQAAWCRVYNAKRSWGVTTSGAFALVGMEIANQSRAKIKIVPGMRFGRLTTVRVAEYDERPQHISTRHLKEHYWHCACDCGGETMASADHLRRGHTQSCGCIRRERLSSMRKRRVLEYNRKKWTAIMITIRRFLALLNPILDDLHVPLTSVELQDIRTEFNHGTGMRIFRITMQLPNGEQITRVIEEEGD